MTRIVKKAADASQLSIDGAGKVTVNQAQSRVGLAMLLVVVAYTIIIGRLAMLGFSEPDQAIASQAKDIAIAGMTHGALVKIDETRLIGQRAVPDFNRRGLGRGRMQHVKFHLQT